MKKILTIFLTLFLLVIQTKMIQNIHLCNGHICSIQTFLNNKSDSCCDNSENSCCAINENEKKCCKDIEILQDIDDVLVEKCNFVWYQYVEFENSKSLDFTFFYNKIDIKINAFEIQTNAPPLFKLYQQYIFYA